MLNKELLKKWVDILFVYVVKVSFYRMDFLLLL